MVKKRIKLICLPSAGGGASMYFNWIKEVREEIDLISIEYRGRGRRFCEELYKNFNDLMEDVFNIVLKQIDNSDFALYGHSLGGIVVFELVHRLQRKNLKPKHVFLSGVYPPYVKKSESNISTLRDDTFIQEIKKLDGIPEEILSDKEILNVFLPIIRSDFHLFESYDSPLARVPIICDITLFNGTRDYKVTLKDIEEWGNCTYGHVKSYQYDGGHFFINHKYREMLKIINTTLV